MDFVAKPNDKRMLTPCRINCDCRGFIRAIKIRRYSGIGTTLVVGDGERATPNFGIRRQVGQQGPPCPYPQGISLCTH